MARGSEDRGDFEDLGRGQDGGAGGGEQRSVDLGGLTHAEVGLDPGEDSGFGGRGLPAADLIVVGAGFDLVGERAAAGGAAECGEAIDDLGEFEDGDAFGVHYSPPSACGLSPREGGREGSVALHEGGDISDAPGVL